VAQPPWVLSPCSPEPDRWRLVLCHDRLPADRVSLELDLWHLLSENAWGVTSKTRDWQAIFNSPLMDF
jgi:hypothetical protein